MKITRTFMIASLALSFAASAKEKPKATPENIPAPAAAAIQAAAGKETTTIKKEKEDGAEAFEAKWKVNGERHEVTVTADGKVIGSKEAVTLDSTPAPVKTAIEGLSSNGKLTTINKKTKKDVVTYSANFETPTGRLEVKLDPTGKEISRETQKKK